MNNVGQYITLGIVLLALGALIAQFDSEEASHPRPLLFMLRALYGSLFALSFCSFVSALRAVSP